VLACRWVQRAQRKKRKKTMAISIEQLNEFIDVHVMERCRHQWKEILCHRGVDLAALKCIHCGYDFSTDRLDVEDAIEDADEFSGKIDYCSPDAPRSLLGDVIEKVMRILNDHYRKDYQYANFSFYYLYPSRRWSVHINVHGRNNFQKICAWSEHESEAMAICLAVWEAMTVKCNHCKGHGPALDCPTCNGTGRLKK